MKKKTIIIIGIIAVVLVSAFFILKPKKIDAGKIDIETAKAEKGSVSKIVSATGTLEATTTVEVGTQVSGIIQNIFIIRLITAFLYYLYITNYITGINNYNSTC